jgi:hypothetical protein
MAFLPQPPRSPEPGIVEEEQEQEATVHEQGNVAVGSSNAESRRRGRAGLENPMRRLGEYDGCASAPVRRPLDLLRRAEAAVCWCC